MTPFLCRDAAFAAVVREVEILAPSERPVLFEGPSGSGRQTLARHLHECSARAGAFVIGRGMPLLTAIPLARDGTLFIDIDEVSSDDQRLLFGALSNRGGLPWRVPPNVRVVSATERHLQEETARGSFRPDLYFRIAASVIVVPPLRERRADLLALLCAFRGQWTRWWWSRDALETFLEYPWPGNVRELEAVLTRLLALAPRGELTRKTLLEFAPELAAWARHREGPSTPARARAARLSTPTIRTSRAR